MSQPSTQIPTEIIQRSGGDWSGYGELSWQQLMELGQQGRIRVLFASDSILVWVLRHDGLSGVYKLLHTQSQQAVPAPQSGELSSELEKVWSLQELLPLFNQYATKYGFDSVVLAAIAYQESGFKNWRVHLDGTGFGLFGLDDNGLLPEFERWSSLQVGRGDQHRPVTPNQQIEYAAMQLKKYQDQLGSAILAAQAWHRGLGAYQDQRGVDYGNLIRTHIARLFP